MMSQDEKDFYDKEDNPLSFNEYQEAADDTAIYPSVGNNPIYPILGLVGEAGEVAEKMKKVIRDKNGDLSYDDEEEVAKELGDVLWYINAVANEIGFDLQDIAQINLDKLSSRKDRGVLRGSGDNR